MSLDRLSGLLVCPACAGELAVQPGRLHCEAGHSYDIARQGYANLLGAAEPANADTAAMLAARERVQAAGVFAQVADLAAHLVSSRSPVLEAGAGTGYYLRTALGDDPAAVGLALDVSKAAARWCARADRRIGSIVADVWTTLPVAARGFGAVLSVFAPRNLAEFARVLRPEGRLVAVTPRPGHLAELRAAHELLDVPAGKAEQLVTSAAEFFDLVDTRVLKYRLDADARLASDLIAMGPNAFHAVPQAVPARTISIDVTVQSFRPLRG